jgi:hypothetical protein
MIDPDPTKRQQKAAHVAKALRVFLASEEQGKEVKEEEKIVAPTERTTDKVDEEPAAEEEAPSDDAPEDEASDEEPTPPPRTRRRPVAAHGAGADGKFAALWEELRPTNRELVFLAGGALALLVLIFLLSLLTGLRITFFAGLLTGAAASYFVDRYLHWRNLQKEPEAADA